MGGFAVLCAQEMLSPTKHFIVNLFTGNFWQIIDLAAVAGEGWRVRRGIMAPQRCGLFLLGFIGGLFL